MATEKILIGMSGGVDSSASAYLLKQQGYDVTGYTLIFREGQESHIDDARRVAKDSGIPFEAIDARQRFDATIINNFLDEYQAGRTPSPCCRCNILKFGLAFEYGNEHDISLVATGHYACAENGQLFCSPVYGRDQAYFLSRLSKKWIENIRFPLCSYEKPAVREIAAKAGLHCAAKKDSQDICFIDTDYRDFLFSHGFKSKKGSIIDETGEQIGTHDGYFRYTIGQRIQLGGLPGKRFVKETDAESNTVVIAEDNALLKNTCTINDLNILEDPLDIPTPLFAKVRSRDSLHPCTVKMNGTTAELAFTEPVRAITPGQLAVVYTETADGKTMVVASGWIEK